MLNLIKKALGLSKPARKKVKLPDGLNQLEVISAKGWWN